MTAPFDGFRTKWLAAERCQDDGHPHAYWCRKITESGDTRIALFCPDCARVVTREVQGTKGPYVTQAELKALTGKYADELPEERSDVRFRPCRLCRQVVPCEYHHVAPQAVFKELADLFPVVPLCKPCHVRVEQLWREYLDAWKGAA